MSFFGLVAVRAAWSESRVVQIKTGTSGGGSLSETKSVDGWSGVINGRPKVGDSAERTRRTRMEDILLFTEMTGDHNPLHYDQKLAEESVFGKVIVQGGVTSGILNALVAEDLPGPGTVFLSVEWKFVKAVGVGEEITGRVEVTDVRPDKPICKIATTVRNQAGDICLTGTATVYTVPLRRS
jgi:acyl dehydratase